MASLSDYCENLIIDHLFRKQAYTPQDVYVALYTAAPSDAGGGTQVSGGGYARKLAGFAAASGGVAANASNVVFDTASGDWGTVVAVGLFDALTAGNLLAWAMLAVSKAVGSGDTFQLDAGDLTLTLD